MTASLYFPLLIITIAAILAAGFGLPSVKKRLPFTVQCWLLSLAPLLAFAWFAVRVAAVDVGITYTWQVEWIPSLGLRLGLYLDSLSMLFALLVTLIGALIIIYTGQYFKGDQSAWRFLTYMLVFLGAMLGLVLAGDILTLFIFWEATSIISFLLIAYKTNDATARQGAFKSLFITAGGGIALLAGLLFMGYIAGSTDLRTIISQGDLLRSSPYYLSFLGLIAFGAFTKSAQFPAHIWLPASMSAPTPASAFLHSATMVKAGIYLLARLNPALGFTESWFWLLTITGLITMLAGAYLGLKQNDIKALLAYSTITQLGILVILLGQDVKDGYKALVIGIVAHALYKSALFMVAGIIDHETGTRDLRRLGGLARSMPVTFAIATVAALSMAGLPPLLGFLAKETLLATTVHPSLPTIASQIFTLSTVIAGALLVAQAGLFIWDTFLGKPRDKTITAHEAPWVMLLAPAVPTLLSLVFAQLPSLKEEALLLATAASTAFGGPVKVSTKLWTGLNIPLLLSFAAITLGLVLFIFRHSIRRFQVDFAPQVSFNRLYQAVLDMIDRSAATALRLQNGNLRSYIVIILATALIVIMIFSMTLELPGGMAITWFSFDITGGLTLLKIFSLLIITLASIATVFIRRDFSAILALGAVGMSMAMLFILEPAPDIALVQIVVDILAVVILVLALTRIPRAQRRQAQYIRETSRLQRSAIIRDAIIAAAAGTVVAAFTLIMLTSRPRSSVVTPYYEQFAKLQTGATDIVGAIVVDFRELDTVIEITVFSMAGLGIYTLLRYARREYWRSHPDIPPPEDYQVDLKSLVVHPHPRSSAFIRIPAFVTLPLAIVLAATHLMYGHDNPGDGFTAGVIISLAIGLWYVVFGYDDTRRRLPWLRPHLLIASGILLALLIGTLTWWLTGSFFGNYDIETLFHLPLPRGFHISSSFLIELAICLSVLGSASYIIDRLGHPDHADFSGSIENHADNSIHQ